MKFSWMQKSGSFNVWHYLVNFWTLLFFSALIFDFFNHNVLSEREVILAIAAIYGAALTIYSAEKEFRRWHNMHRSMHPGEVYAMLWTIIIIFLVVGPIILHIPYHLPPEVSASYIAVISILAITRESKNLYKKRSKSR